VELELLKTLARQAFTPEMEKPNCVGFVLEDTENVYRGMPSHTVSALNAPDWSDVYTFTVAIPVFPDSHETREITCATEAAEAITTPATGVKVSTDVRVVTIEVTMEPKAMPVSSRYFTLDVPQFAAAASAFLAVSPQF
jgi:hypothetical protein